MDITLLLTQQEKDYLHERSLFKGETLFHENERCECIGIVHSGRIRIVSYLSDGKEVIYNELAKDEIFGNNLLFSSDPFYKGNIVSLTDTSLYLLYKEDLLKILHENPQFLMAYLEVQSDFSKTLNARIRLLSIADSEERFLLYMHTHKKEITYVSISELSKQLYMQRETLSRLLSRLEKEKKIQRFNKHIRLL